MFQVKKAVNHHVVSNLQQLKEINFRYQHDHSDLNQIRLLRRKDSDSLENRTSWKYIPKFFFNKKKKVLNQRKLFMHKKKMTAGRSVAHCNPSVPKYRFFLLRMEIHLVFWETIVIGFIFP